MNRDTRLMIVIGIAVVTAAVASFGVYWGIITRPQPPRDPMVDVIVAAKPIEMGVSLTKEQVKRIAWPARIQIPGALSKIEDIENRGLVAAVLENEPITEGKLAPKGISGLTPTIQHGMRAMSVKVNEVIGVAGFVTPGTRVDVLVTVRQDKDSRSRVVVQNVQVLTAGAKYDDPEGRKQGKPIPSTVVTLMVKPADAEKIALASIQGQIMLALRNPLDKKEEPTPGTSVAMLMGPSAPIALPAATAAPIHRTARVVAPPPPPPAPRAIEVFKATKRINRGETER